MRTEGDLLQLQALSNEAMSPLFESTVEAVEEAIINALVAAETMTGRDDRRVEAISIPRLQEILKKYNRLAPIASAPPARKAAE
jgi:L-aminopeptidase/D-esterase-like protein